MLCTLISTISNFSWLAKTSTWRTGACLTGACNMILLFIFSLGFICLHYKQCSLKSTEAGNVVHPAVWHVICCTNNLQKNVWLSFWTFLILAICVKSTEHGSFSVTWLLSRLSFCFVGASWWLWLFLRWSVAPLVTADGVGHTVHDCFWLSLTLHHAAPHKTPDEFFYPIIQPIFCRKETGGKSWLVHKAGEGSD